MQKRKEMLGILLKNGVAYGVVSLVAILCAVCVLIEVLFGVLMSLTTSLREKTMTALDSIVRTCSRYVTAVTTQKLWTNVENVRVRLFKFLERFGL